LVSQYEENGGGERGKDGGALDRTKERRPAKGEKGVSVIHRWQRTGGG